jgi:hypothetical integral membrane protein (TIGR02206 family)
MDHPAFKPFSQEHAVTVGIGFLAIGVLIFAGKRSETGRKLGTAVLGTAGLMSYPLSLAAWMSLGRPVAIDNLIPLHLCDITAFIAGFAILTKRPLLCAMTYFWGLAATMQALLTPAISVGFPAWPFVMFFIQHFAIVGAALYLPIVEGWRPRQPFWKGPLEVYAWSVAYMALALLVNWLLGTNFGFVTRPPDNPSLIDHLGPWPWYLFPMQVLALTLFTLLALPFARRERKP